MEIIDSHIHVGDIYTGRPILRPLTRVPLGLLTVLERLGYRNPMQLLKSGPPPDPDDLPPGPDDVPPAKGLGRLLGDIGYMEVCRRVQAGTPENMLRLLREAGISRAVLLPVEPMTTSDEALRLAREQGAFIPFVSPDFTRADCAERVRAHAVSGARGLKIHPVFQEIRPDDPRLLEVLEAFAPTGLPVCFHAGPARKGFVPSPVEGYAHPLLLEKAVAAFPQVPFIFAHMALEYAPLAVELARRHRNIFLETSIQPARSIKSALQALGPERLLFGSDCPLGSPAVTLRNIRQACRDTSALALVLALNIKRLCRLDEPGGAAPEHA